MLLGDLIARLTDETVVEEILLSFTDLTALAQLRAEAEASGLQLGTFAAAAAVRYASEASAEEWMALLGAMTNAQDPGATYLNRAFAYATRRTATDLSMNY